MRELLEAAARPSQKVVTVWIWEGLAKNLTLQILQPDLVVSALYSLYSTNSDALPKAENRLQMMGMNHRQGNWDGISKSGLDQAGLNIEDP